MEMPASTAVATETTKVEGQRIMDSEEKRLNNDPQNVHGTYGHHNKRQIHGTCAADIIDQGKTAIEKLGSSKQL